MVSRRDEQPVRELQERVSALEQEVREQRALSRRLAELTDVVAELLVPVSQRDPQAADELLRRYRDRL